MQTSEIDEHERSESDLGEASPTPAVPSTSSRLPLSVLLSYSIPSVVLGFSGTVVGLYVLKFATDTLLIAPGLFATAYAMARVWDGLSDPIAGYLSDRTTHASGRRRPWIFLGAIPLAIAFVALWSPPADLTGTPAVVWISVSIFFYYTAYTIVAVPHLALGAEMTDDHHERTRVFGGRGIGEFSGVMLAALALYYFQQSGDPRIATSRVAWIFAVFSIPIIWVCVHHMKERIDHQGRGSHSILSAFGDVAKNPYARILIAVFFLETMSMATITTLAPFVIQYLVPDASDSTAVYIVMAVAVLHLIAIALLLSFKLNKSEHDRIRAAIEARGSDWVPE